MCNPRRVRVRATRRIAEAWRAEIEQAATARGDVSSEARLTQSISDLLPPPAQRAFDQAIQVSPHWTWTGSEYRQSVPGGTVSYRPDTGDLEIAVTLSVAIEALGTATLVATGEVTDEVVANASGSYYDDGYGGWTRENADRRARAAAEGKLDELAAERGAALKHRAEEAAKHEMAARTDEATREARRTAERRLTLQTTEMQADLDEQANEKLEAVQVETLKGVFALVATGYSAALQAYAAENGENLEVSESDGVISIQFEMEG